MWQGKSLSRFKGRFPHLYSKNPSGPHCTGTPWGSDEKIHGKCFPGAWHRAKAQEVANSSMKLFWAQHHCRQGVGFQRLKHIPASLVREDPPQETVKQLSSGWFSAKTLGGSKAIYNSIGLEAAIRPAVLRWLSKAWNLATCWALRSRWRWPASCWCPYKERGLQNNHFQKEVARRHVHTTCRDG